MDQQTAAQSFSASLRHLVESRALAARCGLNHSELDALLRDAGWPQSLAALAESGERLSCADLLDICRDPIAQLCPAEPEGGWLLFCYQYACHVLYPDDHYTAKTAPYRAGAEFFLAVLQLCLDEERRLCEFDPMLDFAFLTTEESKGFERAGEYQKFLSAWREQYVYEMLRLAEEASPYRTLSHIAGVHYVALTVAQGLLAAGIPVDLPLASGASAGHDLGKFGCKPGERVPYLHYYYTDQWFRRIGLTTIGAIAANHSTWDLELDNLPVEALCLIYADFRVKQNRDENGLEYTKIFSLADSFDVILSKLDNVDETKKRRYRFVYARLRDFEDYMRALGVDVDLTGQPQTPPARPEIALQSVSEAIQSLVFLATEHNIRVMDVLTQDQSFGNLLESARSEKNWQHIRSYLDIFAEYSTYLRPAQKALALDFMYELLMHREGDIRRRAANLAGQIIAQYNAGYRKERPAGTPDQAEQTALELWEKLIARIIAPDPHLTTLHKYWIRYTFKLVAQSVFQLAVPGDREEFFKVLMGHYRDLEIPDDQAFPLLDNLYDLPLSLCSPEDLDQLMDFAAACFARPSKVLQIAAARFFKQLAAALPQEHPGRERIRALCDAFPVGDDFTLLYLQYRILQGLGQDTTLQKERLDRREVTGDIFLENLKTGTPWVRKAVNIKLLAERAPRCDEGERLHTATHLANLVKVSENIVVRYDAGAALLRLAPLLPCEHRNEIAVELFKGLETGEYEFSKYIPACLGEFALWLPPEQLDELVQSLRESLGSPNERVVCVALDTVGVLLECSPVYPERFQEDPDAVDLRRRYLLGFLLAGLANHRPDVRQESLLVLGQLFSSPRLDKEEKKILFGLSCKKVLFLLSENRDAGQMEYYQAAALTQINRFITTCVIGQDMPTVQEWDRVAFFPGTFDPFTLSHKGIVRAIRNMGFEVYLSIDEFSWSKNTQPHLIRRQIVNMSVPDMFHVHLFPDSIPVNLANPDDLARLRRVFAGKRVYLVAGSDVVANASAYRLPPQENSVHTFDHVIFRRADKDENQVHRDLSARECIQGEVLELTLPTELEDISSTRIRENLDQGRDISNLIDPVVQEYIYSSSVYLRASRFKAGLVEAPGQFRLLDSPAPGALRELLSGLGPAQSTLCASLPGCSWMVLDSPMGPAALAAFRVLSPNDLLKGVGRAALADELRIRAGGPVVLLLGLWQTRRRVSDGVGLLFSEVLAQALAQGCTYAVWQPVLPDSHGLLKDSLERLGFLPADLDCAPEGMMLCDLHRPLVLLQNLETTFKEPLAQLPALRQVAQATQLRLQRAAVKLFPGQLVLRLSSAVIQQRLAQQITAMNGVPEQPTSPRVLGPLMCVPFGKLLRGRVVPNTVTKTLHTDKVFEPDLQSSTIEAYPGYSNLQSQIRTIRSFDRPVILVDDLLHRNGRLSAVLPLFAQENVTVRAVTLGILSSRGADTMAQSGIPVSGVYHIPSLRYWFVESTLYPFVGGDTVRRPGQPVSGLLPTINQILPYTYPGLEGASRESVFDFSLACLENARDLFRVLETEYRRLFGRNLTLNRLGEVLVLPTCPDKGACMQYDPNLSASVYLENDLEQLLRNRKLMK